MYHRASRSWNLAVLLGLLLMTACTDTSTLPTDMGAQFANKGKKRDAEPQFVITTIDLGTLGNSTSLAKGIASVNGGISVVGSSGPDAFYWTTGGGVMAKLSGEGRVPSLVLAAPRPATATPRSTSSARWNGYQRL